MPRTTPAAQTTRRTKGVTKSDATPTRHTRKTPPPSRRRVRVAEGIYRDRHGLAATVKVNGVQREIRFPAGTPLKTIRARRDELRASLRTLPAGARHTLAHDAARYLQQVSGELVSIADRQYHLGLWTARFGHLRTLALSQHTATLNDQLRQWRETRSASACNHRRDALTNLVKVLYGRRAAAELVDLARFTPPPPTPRWLDRAHIADVLGAVDARIQDRRTLRADALDGHAAVADGTLAAGRLPPRRTDAVRRRAARQGGTTGGHPARRRRAGRGPCVRRDRCLRALVVRRANKALRGAAKRAGRPAFTVYQIRHAFATGLRRTGSDVADIQDLYGHTDPETTMIYAPPQLQKHAAAIGRLQRADRAPAPVSVGNSAGRNGW